MKTWSDIENQFLKDNYPSMPPTQIAGRLGRTPSAVMARVYDLEITARPTPLQRTLVNCKQCGKHLTYRQKTHRGKFCSRQCFSKSLLIEDWSNLTWKISNKGYIKGHAKSHPLATGPSGEILKHWHVLWESNSFSAWVIQSKKAGATIHHKNGDRADNRQENLELRWPRNHPSGITTEEFIEVLKEMGYKITPPGNGK